MRLISILVMALVPISALASAGMDSVPWDTIINQDGGDQVTFGVTLRGPTPYQRNATMAFHPASTTKLFTSALALSTLGPDFRVETRVEWHDVPGHDGSVTGLAIIGNGDPTYAMLEFSESLNTRFDLIAARLRKEGVREVWGTVEARAGDPRWNLNPFPDGWQAVDYVSYYGAQAQAFMIDLNSEVYTVTGIHTGHWSNTAITTPIQQNLTRGDHTVIEVKPTVFSDGEPGYSISGTWVPSVGGPTPSDFVQLPEAEPTSNDPLKYSSSFFLPIPDTTPWARNLFVSALKRNGIRLHSEDAPAISPVVKQVSFLSPPLRDFIKPFMKKSLNQIGDALFKIIGAKFDPSARNLLVAGQEAMREFVSHVGQASGSRTGFDPPDGFFSNDVTLLDGSGVSRADYVTPAAEMALLEDFLESPDFPVLWQALPIAGVDGTLAHRMKGTPAQGVLRAKTGTLSGVYNLAGYVPRINRFGISEFVPFVLLTNTRWDMGAKARLAEDRVGATLSSIVNSNQAE